MNGELPTLTLGFNKNSPVENITVTGNVILGRNDGIRFLHAKSLTFKNNIVYSGFIRFYNSFYNNYNSKTWDFSGNTYYTRKNKTIRIQSKEDFTVEEWQQKYNLDSKSIWKPISEFDLNNVLNITPNVFKKNKYRIVLFSKNEDDVTVDFSDYKLNKGMVYTIKDVEDYSNVVKTGVLDKDKKISFPMKLNKGNENKTIDNFGVYTIEFNKI
jgi:hypothetical protein